MNSYNEMDAHENQNMPFQNVKFMKKKKKGFWHCLPQVKFISLNCLMAWTNLNRLYNREFKSICKIFVIKNSHSFSTDVSNSQTFSFT